MPKIVYRDIKFQTRSLELIHEVNKTISFYEQQGYDLTLRQVYYQLVAGAIIPNTEKSYKSIGNLVNDARLAGLIDWNSITDRTRNVRRNSHWSNPKEVIFSAAQSYALDKWEGQDNYVEVWIEKDALVGVISKVCSDLDIPYFSCRGYVSQSEMWKAAQRLRQYENRFRSTIILHLGDHDPSGIDMTRDIQERLYLFQSTCEVRRIALNMDQISFYAPPPNPAKITDSRAEKYIQRYGYESWELDALPPSVINDLIENTVGDYIYTPIREKIQIREERDRDKIQIVGNYFYDCANLAIQIDAGEATQLFDENGGEI